ncbi:hypothetical protein LTR56_006867 [Elasticomyces elasticus]|nr:hypothetical protein LTR22_016700 [Elasticomyces elasticus]KAK3649391.1 hypothetical protein LTR56_006867 [Elasticomyces elasticus]KAK4928076.1 hypothetical protein LTR49_005275 [Elasticomyces elasticus]KAK5748302.1 hypothetical protein LTS12_021641 [Elasticomyces elasticus]
MQVYAMDVCILDVDSPLGCRKKTPLLYSHVTISNCLNFDLAWALEYQSISADLPYEVQVDFLTPSMPSRLDPKMSTAGQKGKASWRAAVPAQAFLGEIHRSIEERTANFFNSNHMVRLHASYMLQFFGHKILLVRQELLYICKESTNPSPTFCTLKEPEAASRSRTGLDILMLRLAKRVHDHGPAAMLVPWECRSPSCKDEDGEDDLEHPGLFVSKATWKIIKNGKDAVGGEDCYRQLAITSCEEHKGNVLQIRARMIISEETGKRIINAALGVRDRPHRQASHVWQSRS